MNLLITYILLSVFGAFWIASDAETIYIFDVFGKNFHYVWYDSGKRWTYVFRYGWRLAVILSLMMFNVILSCRFFVTNPLRFERGILLLVLALMLLGSCAIVPWIYLAHRLRYERFLRAKALQLSKFINRVIFNGGFTEAMQQAAAR